MKNGICKALLALTTITVIGATGIAQEAGKRLVAAPDAVSKGVACLASQDWVEDDLRELGLRAGTMVGVRFDTGSIPGTSPEALDTTNVLFLSPRGQRGWLLFFRLQQDGTVTAVRNGYRVKRTKEGWSASEGNGGIATYKAMAAYATALSMRPMVRLALHPSSAGCRVE